MQVAKAEEYALSLQFEAVKKKVEQKEARKK